MAPDFDRTRLPSSQPSTPNDEQTRAFLQERLAYLGKVYAAIGASFYLAGNLADAASIPDYLARRSADPTTWVIPAAIAVYLVQWALCRSGRRRLSNLRAVDATTTILAAFFHSSIVFAAIPDELPGLAYARALLLFTFGLLIRATVIPSSPRRTLILGLVAACCPIFTSHLWYTAQTLTTIAPGLHALWTALWCLGAVVIATLASRIIFGLRQQVREASQLGQYTLLEKVGEGGMGAVYRASHAMLRRPTAVKLLQADKAGAERLAHFEREVQLTSLLTHPNTVAVFDYGRTPDGVFYYAMEYLDGLNLEDLVRFDGPQPAGRVVHILRQVAGSLAEAHSIGLIHRDIKPANVILVAERGGAPDAAKVVDFGLVEELDKDSAVTHEIRLAGTPHYVAPETISSAGVGPQSDLYSLGCVGYFLLTGQTVFEGRTVVEVCGHHLHSSPVPPAQRVGRHLPQSLSALVMSCLEKDPEYRPQSARALVDLLDGCHDGEPWTDEMGRAWWRRYSPDVLAHLRHQRAAAPQNLATVRSSSQRATTAMVRSPSVVGVRSSRRQR